FNLRAFGGKAVPPQLATWEVTPINIVRSMDEGLADYHGFGTVCNSTQGPTCTPKFLEVSLDVDRARERDMSDVNKCMTRELRTPHTTLTRDQFYSEGWQYKIGTLFAASLYQAAHPASQDVIMQKSLIKWYDDPLNGASSR